MTRRLILWDIDGTLVSCGPSGREALENGAREASGIARVPHVVMSGKTDPQIVAEILGEAGVASEDIDAMMRAALSEAARCLGGWKDRIVREGFVQPGVTELLAGLDATAGVRQTLVTGNLDVNAVAKVSAFGLEGFFDFEVGAYGTDDPDRDRLVPICLARVSEMRNEVYRPDEVWVIGDTANDLSCARAAGVRCLVVGTGKEGFETVRDLDADFVFEDLDDTDHVLEVLTKG